MGGARVTRPDVLRQLDGFTPAQHFQGLDQQGRAPFRQPVVQGPEIVLRVDGHPLLEKNRSRVHFVPEPLDSHPGLLFPPDQGPIDGGRAPVPGQQRGVDIEDAH